VKFWEDKEVPGVADTIRKTKLKQDQKSRQTDMSELLKMVQEGRIHEADERQLENLKLALELNRLLEPRETPTGVSPEALVEAVKQAITEGMSNVTINAPAGTGGAVDPSRPQMKHTSLADLAQDDTKVDIANKEDISSKVEGEENTDKLEQLRKLKGKS
jgi:hypothetical protein